MPRGQADSDRVAAMSNISSVTLGKRVTPLSFRVLMREEEIMTPSISHDCYEHFWCTHRAHGKF